MAATITIQQVKDFANTGVADSIIQIYIDMLAQADQCLDASGISEPQQMILKLTAVSYLLTMQTGGGIKSETDMDGESVTFKDSKSSSNSLDLLRGLDGYSCISPYIDKPKRYAASINSGC